jgi:hypothetical protein
MRMCSWCCSLARATGANATASLREYAICYGIDTEKLKGQGDVLISIRGRSIGAWKSVPKWPTDPLGNP